MRIFYEREFRNGMITWTMMAGLSPDNPMFAYTFMYHHDDPRNEVVVALRETKEDFLEAVFGYYRGLTCH